MKPLKMWAIATYFAYILGLVTEEDLVEFTFNDSKASRCNMGERFKSAIKGVGYTYEGDNWQSINIQRGMLNVTMLMQSHSPMIANLGEILQSGPREVFFKSPSRVYKIFFNALRVVPEHAMPSSPFYDLFTSFIDFQNDLITRVEGYEKRMSECDEGFEKCMTELGAELAYTVEINVPK
jgi:hypothetical protein